jgi:HEAT repeat protein
MDLANRLIAWAAYVTGAVLIGSGAFFTFHYYRQSAASADLAKAASNVGGETGSESWPGAVPAMRGAQVEQLYLQRAQIRRLQALLDQKTKLLQQRTALLDQKSAEQVALRAELDEAIELLEVLAAELAATATSPSAGQAKGEKLQTELEKLRSESTKSRMAADQQQGELDRLKDEVGATDVGITQLQLQAESEFNLLVAERQAFEAVVSETFVRLGVDAIPVLVYQLANPRADVRQWAATVLGELGPTARDAIPPLSDALRDKNEAVRGAARRALEKIDTPHR